MEVAVKLAHTLWRKTRIDQCDLSEQHLINLSAEALDLSEWEWAEVVADFAFNLPRHSSEKYKLMLLVNKAIATKHGGRPKQAFDLLDSIDWTAKALDFQMAVEVLRERNSEAAALMQKIGRSGQVIEGDASYHMWPLFRDFRDTKEFQGAFQTVYGISFETELGPLVAEAEVAAVSSGLVSSSGQIDPIPAPTEDAPEAKLGRNPDTRKAESERVGPELPRVSRSRPARSRGPSPKGQPPRRPGRG